MLKRFEVTNFKNFNEKFVFDLSETKQYTFNEECVENGIVKTGMIYGPNGCGKTNLGYALFDIKNHLTDDKINPKYKRAYLNASTPNDKAEFKYHFVFDNTAVEYYYCKTSANTLITEIVTINGDTVIYFNREKDISATVNIEGTENLNTELDNNNLSIVKYTLANSIISPDHPLSQLKLFVDKMHFVSPIESHHYFQSNSNETNWLSLIIDEKDYTLDRFEKFLNDAGVKCKLFLISEFDDERLAFDFGYRKIDFQNNASSGTLALTALYARLRVIEESRFVYVDEFDAFYHHSLSKLVVKEFKSKSVQAILTTHNTSIMTNDLLRPDCYFKMTEEEIKPIYQHTYKELRKAHSIEKMYRAGAFSE